MSVNNTLEQRGSRYGRFADHARIAQSIQDTMRAAPRWEELDHDMKQALSVIADKIARILNGDPYYTDNWHDIQGYAKLIEDRIEMIPSNEQELFEKDGSWQLDDGTPVSHGVPSEIPFKFPLHDNPILKGGPGFNGA